MSFGKIWISGVIWLMASMFCVADTNIWLTTQANHNAWPGTATAPFSVRNADALTSILVTNTPNYTFHYAAGTYQTYGYYFQQRSTANKGCKHYGAGIDKTVIQLVGSADGPCGVIFGGDGDKLMDGFELHDMTLDCNAVHNARYTNGIGPCIGVMVGGNDLLMDGVKVINFGTGGTNSECFPIAVGPLNLANNNPYIRNQVVQHCIVCSPAPTNACGVSPVSVAAAPGYFMSNCVVRYCSVSNLTGHFLNGPHSFRAPLVENCLGENLDIGMYFEPGFMDDAHRDWVVRSNVFKNVTQAVNISYPPGQRIKSLTIEGNTFVLNCPPSEVFGDWCPNPGLGEGIDWLVLRNNTIIQTNCLTTPGSVGFRLTRASNAVVQSNQMILGPGVGLVLDSSTVTNVWFSGNIDATCAPLPVTNRFLGTLNSQAAATRWQRVTPPVVNVRLQPGP